MITIRSGQFETNSSSSHSMILISEENYEKWQNNKLFVVYGSTEVYSYDEVVQAMKNDKNYTGEFTFEYVEEYAYEYFDATSYNTWCEDAYDIEKLVKDGMIAIGFEYGC